MSSAMVPEMGSNDTGLNIVNTQNASSDTMPNEAPTRNDGDVSSEEHDPSDDDAAPSEESSEDQFAQRQQVTPTNKRKRKRKDPNRRKNIRKIMSTSDMSESAKAAAKAEEERRKRQELKLQQHSLEKQHLPLQPPVLEPPPKSIPLSATPDYLPPLSFDISMGQQQPLNDFESINSEMGSERLANNEDFVEPHGQHNQQAQYSNGSSGTDHDAKYTRDSLQRTNDIFETIELDSASDSDLEVEVVAAAARSVATTAAVPRRTKPPPTRPPPKQEVIEADYVEDSDDEMERVLEKVKKPKATFVNDTSNVANRDGKVPINILRPKDEPEIFLPDFVASMIKPHQIGGIRFMWDNLVEDLEEFQKSDGLGCILAHSMGLGKTLQVTTFLSIFLKHTSATTAIIIVPVNVLDNWIGEFKKWLPPPDAVKIFAINDAVKTFEARHKTIKDWSTVGGVLIIGYEMFRNLVSVNGRLKAADAKVKEKFNIKVLNRADLVVCDEGHRIKNKDAAVSVALKKVDSKRRLVLTGYPLQNNLVEYWCMVDFVRPAYLGSLTEFENMFNQPILNGQCIDSKPEDIKLMRERSYILHKQLEGFIQRRGHEVLAASLPKKFEYIMPIRLSKIQEDLYTEILRLRGVGPGESAEVTGNGNIFKSYAMSNKVWNHPDVLYKLCQKQAEADPEEDLVKIDVDWAKDKMANYIPGNLENSYKMLLAVKLIEFAVSEGGRVLLFSQNLGTLDVLEEILSQRQIPVHGGFWSKKTNFFRLDGSTCSADRQKMITKFNSISNRRCHLFLISTKAGSLGINLIGANRVIVMDSSWNPCHDAQAVCRIYRYGQKKACFIYRMVAAGTMENKVYDRQIAKMGLASRVVDTQSTDRIFSQRDLKDLFVYKPPDLNIKLSDPSGGEDPAIAAIYGDKDCVRCFAQTPKLHDSFLAPDVAGNLSQNEQEQAMLSYAKVKLDQERGTVVSGYNYARNTQNTFNRDRQQAPTPYGRATAEEVQRATTEEMQDCFKYIRSLPEIQQEGYRKYSQEQKKAFLAKVLAFVKYVKVENLRRAQAIQQSTSTGHTQDSRLTPSRDSSTLSSAYSGTPYGSTNVLSLPEDHQIISTDISSGRNQQSRYLSKYTSVQNEVSANLLTNTNSNMNASDGDIQHVSPFAASTSQRNSFTTSIPKENALDSSMNPYHITANGMSQSNNGTHNLLLHQQNLNDENPNYTVDYSQMNVNQVSNGQQQAPSNPNTTVHVSQLENAKASKAQDHELVSDILPL